MAIYRCIDVVGPCKSKVSNRPVGRIPFQSYSYAAPQLKQIW